VKKQKKKKKKGGGGNIKAVGSHAHHILFFSPFLFSSFYTVADER
jgi:hypothetical protein